MNSNSLTCSVLSYVSGSNELIEPALISYRQLQRFKKKTTFANFGAKNNNQMASE